MAGGLERNIILTANYFATLGHNVSLITFDLPGSEPFYPLDERVTWHCVGKTTPHTPINFFDRFRLMGRIRKKLKAQRATILVCFHHGILGRFITAATGLNVKIICSERNSLTIYQHIRANKWNANFFLLALVKRITVQFEEYTQQYPRWLRKKIITIPNPVSQPNAFANTLKANTQGRFQLLCIGRLCKQKRQDLLLESFNEISSEINLWDLVFVGDGDKKNSLRSRAKELNLENRVFFHGNTSDISETLGSSHLFCMPSEWEGFPNALAEAMAHRLPCIGFDNCAGVKHLIKNGHDGYLVQGEVNSKSLAHSILALIKDPTLRDKLGANAQKKMMAFEPKMVLQKWDKLVEDVLT